MNYKNASFTLAGIACSVYLLNILFWQLGLDGRSLVPGFSAMSCLVAPVLAAWLGTLIRKWTGCPRLWVSILLGAVGLFFFIKYVTIPDLYTFVNYGSICSAMIIVGYLIPEKQLETSAGQGGIIPAILVFLASVLCFTCIEVVDGRLFNYPFPAENADMHKLIRLLLQMAEGTSIAIATYFAVILSYSPMGQTISEKRWVRIVFSVICTLASVRIIGMAFSIGFPSIYSFIRIVSCPLCIYLAVLGYRWFRKRSPKSVVCLLVLIAATISCTCNNGNTEKRTQPESETMVIQGKYAIVVGVYHQKEQAQKRVQDCIAKGYEATIVPQKNGLIAVVICPTNSKEEALRSLDRAKAAGVCPDEGWILTLNSEEQR